MGAVVPLMEVGVTAFHERSLAFLWGKFHQSKAVGFELDVIHDVAVAKEIKWAQTKLSCANAGDVLVDVTVGEVGQRAIYFRPYPACLECSGYLCIRSSIER